MLRMPGGSRPYCRPADRFLALLKLFQRSGDSADTTDIKEAAQQLALGLSSISDPSSSAVTTQLKSSLRKFAELP